jgi:hypothetical protein
MRWNGNPQDTGYPSQGKYPIWHVVPDFIAGVILDKLLSDAKTAGDLQYYSNIEFAINELKNTP